MEVTLLLVIAIFAINVYLARPVLEAFLFSMALAVGLPAIAAGHHQHQSGHGGQAHGPQQSNREKVGFH